MTDEQQAGFEIDGEFYPISLTSGAKDILLIDRVTNMTLEEFQEALDDPNRMRGAAILGLIATSIRAKYPDWSVERIVAAVMAVDFENLVTIGDAVEDPTAGGQTEPPPAETDGSSTSPSAESSSSPTPTAVSSFATSAVTRG